MTAIQHAYRVINWQENLPGDEMPPEWMWPLGEPLEDWFKTVEYRRKQKYGVTSDDDDDDDFMENELARGRR